MIAIYLDLKIRLETFLHTLTPHTTLSNLSDKLLLVHEKLKDSFFSHLSCARNGHNFFGVYSIQVLKKFIGISASSDAFFDDTFVMTVTMIQFFLAESALAEARGWRNVVEKQEVGFVRTFIT